MDYKSVQGFLDSKKHAASMNTRFANIGCDTSLLLGTVKEKVMLVWKSQPYGPSVFIPNKDGTTRLTLAYKNDKVQFPVTFYLF